MPAPSPSSAPAASKPHTTRTILLSLLALLVTLPILACIVVATYDWNRAKPWLNARVADALDRPFAIRGDLSVRWEQPASQMAGQDKQWRDYLPWPHLLAKDVHLGNPAGMAQTDAATIVEGAFSLNPLALLQQRIEIPLLRFQAPRLALLRVDATHNNWTFKQNTQPSRWQFELERVVLTQGVVQFDDAVTNTHVLAKVATLDQPGPYGIAWTVTGMYSGAPVTGGGKAGAVLSLKNQDTPFPIQADLRSGSNRVTIEGTATRPAQLAAIDVQLSLAGRSMARLYELTGVLLPETPPFATAGHLTGTIDRNGSQWTYDNFKGKVGSSDISGKLAYRTGKPRGYLSGNIESKLLNFKDLGPLVGADSNASKKVRGATETQPAGKVLPVEQFRTARWKTIDADVRYSAARILRDEKLALNKLSTHVLMNNGVLTLAPLDFGLAGGDLSSTIRLDGSGDDGQQAIKATMNITARNIQIKQLFPTIEQMQATVGEINGDAQLSASGDSIASLLGKSNGEVKARIGQGSISKLLLEEMGLNLGSVIIAKVTGDKQVKLNCMATDFRVDNGLMNARRFVIDTEEALVDVDGTINLATEELDLILRPQTKGVRVLSLRAPLYVKGPFSKPKVSVDMKTLAMKGGAAVLLAVIAPPLAALVPLTQQQANNNADCASLLANAKVKPVAPPPGQRVPFKRIVR
ncbi:AsmA family protein [Massilia sp. S19_KUP03_FR1]|uniref:AsmA family protein n=1 Tax=Massilia sp. S19_KUP03_FR1 TaxID=3025503 RepID=UPI002FCDA856